MDGGQETGGADLRLGRGCSQRVCSRPDPSRHLLWGLLLADQTPTVRLFQPGGFRVSCARLEFGVVQE